MPRLELPHDAWADLREPDEIPRGAARRFRKTLYKLAAPAADVDQTLDADAQAAAVAKAMMATEGGMDGIEDLAEALVLASVSEWSYGSVCSEVLEDIPDKAIDLIYDACQGYIEKLMPDFGPSQDEDSPTTPS
jgi:hypothetical protein